ncbi:MAG: metallophosphoesterase family protein [Candidatus Omnitrophica bacterium]|nr:metallophosphoesterase family protein [Candidatus Omnitrophota bacterium]
MKIAVVADTHSLPLPVKLLEALSKADLIIHAGDLCDLETLKTFQKIKEVKAVQGNMCDPGVKKKLPLKEYFECEGVKIGVYHGDRPTKDALANAKEQFKGVAVDIVIFGHSHQALNQTMNRVIYFNPGSPNDVVKAKFFSYGLIEIRKDKIQTRIIKL